jgi:hypothetical protein
MRELGNPKSLPTRLGEKVRCAVLQFCNGLLLFDLRGEVNLSVLSIPRGPYAENGPTVAHCREGLLARTCKMFRNRHPPSASTGDQAGEPTPIFRGRLRCAVMASCLSRRRPRVRVPSTPPTFAHACQRVRELRLASHAKVVHRSATRGGGPPISQLSSRK